MNISFSSYFARYLMPEPMTDPPRLVALLFGAALLGLVSHGALAAQQGTASGTTISNLATLNSVGGVSQTAIGSSPTGNTSGAGTATTFVVDKKVNGP